MISQNSSHYQMLVSGLPRQHYCGTGGRSSWQFGRAWLFLPGFCPALLDLRNLRNAVSGWRLSQSWTDRVDRSIFWGQFVVQKDQIIKNIETRGFHAPWDYDVKVREAGAKILDAPKINLNSLLHQADLSSFYRLPLISYLMDIIISINHGDNQNLEQIRGRSHNSHLQPDCPVDSGVNISHLSFSFGHLLQIYLAWQIWTLTGEKTADDQWGAVGGFQAAWGQWGA